MKHMKKLLGLLLTVALMLAMSVAAFAAETTANNSNVNQKGKITIENATVGETYSIYKILDLESYDADKKAYSYTVNSTWTGFFTGTGKGLDYVSVKDGYVSWKTEKNEASDVEAFAKAALAYAKENSDSVKPVASKEAKAPSGDQNAKQVTLVFDKQDKANESEEALELALGYYLVDTTLGTLCSLDTTNAEVTMKEKNTVPTITKQVQEDSDNNWGASNTAQIGDTVNFKVTIHAKKGAENYVLHDKMDAGLTFGGTVTVKAGESDLETSNYTLTTEGLTDDCTFELAFKQDYLDTITAETDIVVTYSAVLNKDAKISTDTNNNTAKLTYADNNTTEDASTSTATFKFDIVKTDSSNKLLNGAEFELYDAQTGGNKISLVKESVGNYRVATTAETSGEGEFTSAVIEAGKVTVKGLDVNTTYWLEETKAPAGYNKLSGRVEVKMESANKTATMTDENTYASGGVHVINKTGTELPSTGGIGTTIFYVAGSVLVLAAAVLLITKKRMSEEK